MVQGSKEDGCQYGRIRLDEMEKRLDGKIKDLSSGCDWGRTVRENLDDKIDRVEKDLSILESRVWKLVVGLQILTIILNIIIGLFKL